MKLHGPFLVIILACSGGKNNEYSELTKAEVIGVTEDFVNPPQILIEDPIRIDPDTCPKPGVFSISESVLHSNTSLSLTGFNTLNEKPKTVPAANLLHLQNYNTEQGLALSCISFGDKSAICDKLGNMWFATAGGGLSRFDGNTFVNFTKEYGLTSDAIFCVTEDRKGNFWIGTLGGGLSCYNGVSFKNYYTENGLVNNTVISIAEDSQGDLWIATEGGVSCLELSKREPLIMNSTLFTNYTTANGLVDNIVYSIAEDENGFMWFGTSGGASRLQKNPEISRRQKEVTQQTVSITNFTTAQGLAHNSVRCITPDSKGNIWFGTAGGGVSRYDRKSFTNYNASHGLANNIVWCITEDKAGIIWCGTNGGGVSRYNGFTFTNYTTTQGLANNTVLSITEDKTGNLWFGTAEGVSLYYGEAFTFYSTALGSTNNYVRSILEDTKGNFWFGTDGGGICRYSNEYFTFYTKAQGLASNTINTIEEDDVGNIWFGTYAGGAYRLAGNIMTHFTTAHGLVDNTVFNIRKDKKGNLWFCTFGGISCFNGKSFTNFTTTHGLLQNSVRSVLVDNKGNNWFGTIGEGVSKYDGESFTNYTIAQGLANNAVLSIVEDSAGYIWFGTFGGGISRFDGKSFANFTTVEGLANNNVASIILDKTGVLWIGTNLGLSGLYFQHSDSVSTLVPGGLVKADNEEILLYKPIWKIYNINTGYPMKDIYSGSNNGALFCDSKNNLWISTASEQSTLVRFNPALLRNNEQPIPVYIKNIKINNANIGWYGLMYSNNQEGLKDSMAIIHEELMSFGKELTTMERRKLHQKFAGIRFDSIVAFNPIPKNLVLPYTYNNVTFEFNAIATSRHFLVRFKYMLDGYDKDWSPATSQTTASFGNITEGYHTFRLIACSPDGVWSDPITYTFRVLPPWYRTWWFRSIATIIVSGLLIGVYLMRVNTLKKQKLTLEKLVTERTSEVEEKNLVLIKQARKLNSTNRLLEKSKQRIEEQALELIFSNKKLSQLNATKDKFFSIIAHDLKNPFSSVLGLSDILSRQYDTMDDTNKRDLINAINESSNNLFKLLENLLEWARTQTGSIPFNPESFELIEVIEKNLLQADNLVKVKGLSLKHRLDKKIMVFGDINMIDAVLRNLITNAVKFTETGGITIEVKQGVEKTTVRIIDTGVGLGTDNPEQVFNVLGLKSTLGTKGESGTGLGLIVCKEFIEKNGGTISVESKVGEGSVFYFTIPNKPSTRE